MTKGEKDTAHKGGERKASHKKEAPAAHKAKEVDEAPSGPKTPPRLKETYFQQIVPALMKEFSYKNPMQVPRLERVILNVGMGEAIQNVKLLESAVTEMGVITGQRPVVKVAALPSPDPVPSGRFPWHPRARQAPGRPRRAWTPKASLAQASGGRTRDGLGSRRGRGHPRRGISRSSSEGRGPDPQGGYSAG